MAHDIKPVSATTIYHAIRARLNLGIDLDNAVRGAIRECGPLRSARVSSAQAKGAAKKYAYWGAVRYSVRLTRSGALSHTARERASSDRRSERLAGLDCDALEKSEDRICLGQVGPVAPIRVIHALGINL